MSELNQCMIVLLVPFVRFVLDSFNCFLDQRSFFRATFLSHSCGIYPRGYRSDGCKNKTCHPVTEHRYSGETALEHRFARHKHCDGNPDADRADDAADGFRFRAHQSSVSNLEAGRKCQLAFPAVFPFITLATSRHALQVLNFSNGSP